ncbi:MAG: asparagine synthase (glutamine-hydrolyzing) [Planctomycetota bacterium]
MESIGLWSSVFMCGICGVIGLPPTRGRAATERMARAMVHRGPDDEGFAEMPLTGDPTGPVAAFGFRRLAILDLSPAGHQPMVNPATGDVIVFNGEIYNFADLRAKLQAKGHVFRSTGDTEVLLHALSEWGEGALDELDGMFGLAFYQASTRRVLLARGPLGIKPLYLARVRDAVVFASEVRAVLASGLVPNDLDPAGIASFFAYGAPQDPLTVHRFVRSLPAGSLQWIGLDDLRGEPGASRRYWRFPQIDPTLASVATAPAATLDLMSRSVRGQCVADVPLGVFLSACIDSAAIAALAQPQHGAVHTFSVGFETEGAEDETEGAAQTAMMLGTRHFQTIVDDEWAVAQFTEWLRSSDRPSIDGLNTFIVSGAARDRGITVALSGLGADELFGGYSIFERAAKLRRWMRPLAWVPRWARRAAAAAAFAPLPAMKRAKAIEMVARGASPADLAIFARRLYLDDRMARLGFAAPALGLTADWLPPEACGAFEPGGDPFHDVSQAEMSLYMGNTLLRDSDVNSMAHSLELRVPFLGRELVNYVCSLPGVVRAPPGSRPKHLLREAIRGSLPRQVFDRPKTGFTLPVDVWMKGGIHDACEAAVESLAACPLFEAQAVRQTWRDFQNPRIESHWSRRIALVVLGSYLAGAAKASTAST